MQAIVSTWKPPGVSPLPSPLNTLPGQSVLVPFVQAQQSKPVILYGSTSSVIQQANYAPITIQQQGAGGMSLIGGANAQPGNIQISQNPQFTSNVSQQYQNTLTQSYNYSTQTSNISNIVNYLIQAFGGGAATGGYVTANPSSPLYNVPSTTVSPYQGASQTATPTQTTQQGISSDSWTTIIILAIIAIGGYAAYKYFSKKKRKNA